MIKIYTFMFTGLMLILFTGDVSASLLNALNIDQWGYHDAKHSKYNEKECLRSFRPTHKTYREIKSKEHSTELEDTFYRFTLIQEVYETQEQALARLLDIQHPNFQNSKASKMCAIRNGFIFDDSVYQVHTDVGVFKGQLDMLLNKLKTLVTSQNLTGTKSLYPGSREHKSETETK